MLKFLQGLMEMAASYFIQDHVGLEDSTREVEAGELRVPSQPRCAIPAIGQDLGWT